MPSSTIKEEIGSEEVSDDVPLGSQMPEESLSDVPEAIVVAGDFSVVSFSVCALWEYYIKLCSAKKFSLN